MNALLKVFIFLLMLHPVLCLALGLGDFDLQSNLGEPLVAQIAITDADSLPELSCLTLQDINPSPAFKKAKLTLKKNGEKSVLQISTSEVMTDPILNLRLSLHCEPNINREYVVLLDPAPVTSPLPINAPLSSTTLSDNAEQAAEKTNKRKTTKNAAIAATAPSNLTAPRPTKKKKSKAALDANKALEESYAGIPTTNTPNNQANLVQKPAASNTNAQTSKPLLIISGNHSAANTPSLSLRLDTQLDLNRKTTIPEVALNTDTLDEVTVMANRMAHLEKQINLLQTQNARLKNEAAQAAQENNNWFHGLLSKQVLWLGLILVTILIAIAWVRRQLRLKRLQHEDAQWFEAETDVNDQDRIVKNASTQSRTADATQAEAFTLGAAYAEPSFDKSGFSAYPNAFVVSDHDENESVLDHADVFIAHDRPAMAIQLLQNHLVDLPLESPEIWLKLINLLALEGTEDEYDKAVDACKQFFNIKLPDFANGTLEDTSSIEDYPHIIIRLQDVWGSEFAVEFMNDLIYNKQSQPREGFGRKTFEDLFFLKQIASATHAANKGNVKSNAAQPNAAAAASPSTPSNPSAHTTARHQAPEILSAAAFFDAPEAVAHDFQNSANIVTLVTPDDASAASAPAVAETVAPLALEMHFPEESTYTKKDNQKSSAIEQALSSAVLDANAPLAAEEIDFSNFLDEITMESSDAAPELTFTLTADASQTPTGNTVNTDSDVHSTTPLASAPLTIEWDLPETNTSKDKK